MTELHHEAYQKTVQDIVNLYEDGHLNLSPGFQRDSVWTESDRRKLIDSLIRNYPLPNIFLYRREHGGEIIYDVIDGKQRLESILMFTGAIRGHRFWAKVQLPGDDEKDWLDWSTLCRQQKQHLITGYQIRVIDVSGDPADIIDLFVRINSTGKALTSAEKRKAKYYNSVFLKAAAKLAAQQAGYFRDSKILSPGQITRMKHIELICELMISIYQGDVLNKKNTLDKVMDAKGFTAAQTEAARAKTVQALNRVQRMFPQLHTIRFRQVSDFYSLVVLLAKFEAEKLILTDKHRNQLAWKLLKEFSVGVDEVRLRLKSLRGPQAGSELYREYLSTVLQATDEISQRRKREEILRGLLQSVFEKKDSQRAFSLEQRRILWNSTTKPVCAECKKPLTWDAFTVDHIDPFSKGGRTKIQNAALMCRSCNSSKGNR